ncbi:PREDICTED: F-box/kelch-repeat protein At1g15670-like [Ipomoea nil]|uniref:F-box/kelch-repeat protein At1g15670-like n=1 Tax=Ipomoea nil TaxID=35883 RepID=UPI000901B6E6|nr:PREDICTED: F-box/kelch-repeat protein At1g15670-like [Ipomoea nil]
MSLFDNKQLEFGSHTPTLTKVIETLGSLAFIFKNPKFSNLIIPCFNFVCMELIPGLPNEVALECLIRISFDQFPKAASVCRAWNGVIKQPEFLRRRKASGLTRPFIAMAQSKDRLCGNQPVCRLTLFEPVKGRCYDVPPIPEMVESMPVFCRVVGIGPELAVIGGCDRVTGEFLKSVFIYNFLSARWRRGADMPGNERLFFGCAASEEEGMVVVAGGLDSDNNSLNSTLAYDMARDRWMSLPDMSYGRDQCTCVFHRGKFHAIGSYYEVEANQITETLDLVTRQWHLSDRISDVMTLSYPAIYLEICGVIYIVNESRDVIALQDGTWVVITRVPDEICSVAYVTRWQGKMMVMGSRRAYMLEVKSKKWTKVEIPSEYCGYVLSSCCIDL